MTFSAKDTRFFEIEGKTFTAGNRTFSLNEPDIKGINALVVPFGIKTSSYNDSQVLSVELTPELEQDIKQLEDDLISKLNLSCPDFVVGTQKFYSIIKRNGNQAMINFKVNPSTTWSYFNVKKGTFTKSKMDQALPGSKVYIDFTINHPWKLEINDKIAFGLSLKLDDVVICDMPSEAPKIVKRKSLKDKMTEQLKKRTKMMDHKE